MEDFMILLKRGVIYDGCPIVAKGTIRVRDGEISIDTMHNLMAVDGKSFATLCEPGCAKNEQGNMKETEDLLPEIWRAKIDELTLQNEKLVEGMRKTVESMQTKLKQEYELRAAVEESLERERHISAEATHLIMELKAKLAEELDRNETLKAHLDSSGLLLEEKEEKLREIQLILAERDAEMKVHEVREKEALLVSEELRDHVVLLQEERTEEKKNSAVLMEDFNEWRNNSEEEISALKKELEHSRATITTLQNELEVAGLEDSGYQQTIASLQKENNTLKHSTELLQSQRTQDTPSRKLRGSATIKNLIKNISNKTSKEKEEKREDKKENKKEKREMAKTETQEWVSARPEWVAARPSVE